MKENIQKWWKGRADIIFSVINFFFLVFFIYVFVLNILNIGNISWFAFLLLPVFILLSVFTIKKIITIKDNQLLHKINKIIQIINFIFLIFMGFSLRVGFSWDYGGLQRYAINYARTGSYEDVVYLAIYPNNQFIFWFLSVFYRVVFWLFGDVSDMFYLGTSIVLNACFISLAVYLYSLLAKKIKNEKFSLLVTIFTVIFLPIASYTSIFYTDTTALFFVPLILLLYLKYLKKEKIIYLLLISFVSVMAFSLKATLIFCLFAIVLDLFIKNDFLPFFKKFVIVLVTCLISLTVVNNLLSSFFKIDDAMYDRYKFPHTHHVMMALYPGATGGYISEEVQYTKSFTNYNAKKKANLKVIKKRLKNYGVSGTLKHLAYTKVNKVWTNVAFGSDNYTSRYPFNYSKVFQVISMTGKYHKYSLIYLYVLWIFFIVGLLMASLKRTVLKHGFLQISKVIILLLAFFLMIWEANSRYLVQILPLIVLASISGWYEMINDDRREKQ